MSMSAGTSVGRRNSGRSGPVASDQAKSSAYKGVSWHKHSQKWYAYIQSGGKMRGLGYFDSQADAAKAYDAEARKVPPIPYFITECPLWSCADQQTLAHIHILHMYGLEARAVVRTENTNKINGRVSL